jgi:hypothetical protein
MKDKKPVFINLFCVFCVICLFQVRGMAAETGKPAPPEKKPLLTLSEALMCEEIVETQPVNPAVVFSVERGKVLCYTAFEEVPKKTSVIHEWYFRDRLLKRTKLGLKPPRWATFSRMQLRDADKGPWQVVVRDEKGNVLKILRFSITD